MKGAQLKILSLLFCLLLSKTLFAQSEKDFVAIEMKSGQVIYGALLFQSNDIIVIQTTDGDKFQYRHTDIKEIRPITKTEIDSNTITKKKQPATANLGVIVQIKGGGYSLQRNRGGGFSDINLIIGHRNVTSKHMFAGIGMGYRGIFMANQNINFIPLFIHLETNNHVKRLSPHFSIDAGYAFCTSENRKSGVLTELSFGGQYRINSRTSFNFAIFGTVQQTRMELTQKINGDSFVYNGNAAILGGGLKMGLLF